MAFSYISGVAIDENNYATACDFSQASPRDNNTAHPEWVNEIKIQALNAFKAAFASLPAIVRKGDVPRMFYGGGPLPYFTHTVYIDGSWFPVGTGNTTFSDTTFSWAFYPKILGAAETNLGSYGQSSAFIPPFTDSASMLKLMTALGKGIGNTAAHEVGWEISQISDKYPLPYMDCNEHTCEGGDQYVYESEGADEWKFVDWSPPIHWLPTDKCSIEKYLLNSDSCK